MAVSQPPLLWQFLNPHCFTGSFFIGGIRISSINRRHLEAFFYPIPMIGIGNGLHHVSPNGHDTMLKSGEYLFDTAILCVFCRHCFNHPGSDHVMVCMHS